MKRRSFMKAGLAASFIPVSGQWVQAASHDSMHQPVSYLRSNWSKDPFSYGSYSYVAKGARNKDRVTLSKPIDNRIFFAGEAYNKSSGSGVHSAYESGVHVSEQILEAGIKQLTIVGAGVCGLSVAHRLRAKGVDVSIIEARDRIGGRIYTEHKSLGSTVDLGASWIHNGQKNPITPIADQLKIERSLTQASVVVRGAQGKLLSEDDLPDWLEDVRGFGHGLGASGDQVNWRAYVFDTALDGDQLLFPGGYSQIFQAFKGDYDVSLKTELHDVTLQDDGVLLGISKGRSNEKTTTEAVLITVPLGVLKSNDIRFEPPLPDTKQDAISKMGMGLLDKLYLKFDKVFWDKDAQWIVTPDTGLAQGEFNEWLNLYPLKGEPILTAFNGGQPAHDLAKLSDQEILNRAVQALGRAYPKAIS